MLCPKCKKNIEENSLICKSCNSKIGTLCKSCGAYNLITSVECMKCKKPLLKICTECGAANLPDAISCRRCNIEFVTKATQQEDLKPLYSATMNSQQKVKAKLIEAIKDSDIRIITINGESGSGKNLVLRSAISELKSTKLIWLMGNCNQITQLSPFGYFQDLLLNFLPATTYS